MSPGQGRALRARRAIPFARGRRPHTPGTLNKTEQAFDAHLEQLLAAGEILWKGFEAIKLKIARRCFYTPDFVVLNTDQTVTLYEVKGFWEDDARVKIKAAAEKFMLFRFVAVTFDRKSKDWAFEEFQP